MRRGHVVYSMTLILIGLLSSFAGEGTAGGPERSLVELTPLIPEALNRNPEVIAMREQAQAMIERIPQARALNDPEFKIQLWNTPENLDVTKSQRTIYGLAQRFPFPGTLSQQEQIAVYAAKQTAKQLAAKEREITAEVKRAYFELFYSHKAIEIHHDQVMLLKQFFKIANAKFRVGKGTQVDVLKAQVEVSKRLQHLPVLKQGLDTANARLNTLLSRDVDRPLGIPRAPLARQIQASPEQLQEQAFRLRPELQEAEFAIAQSQATTKLAKLRYYPHLRLELQRWQNRNIDDGWGGNVTVNLPFAFWTKPKYDAQVREATAQVHAAQSRKRMLENETRFQIKDLLSKIRSLEQIVTLYTTTVLPQAKHTLNAAMAGYRTDRTDFLTLIEADRALITYRLEYYRALVDLEQQMASLERVVGIDL